MERYHHWAHYYNQEIGWIAIAMAIVALILFFIAIVFDESDWLSGRGYLLLCIGDAALIVVAIIMGIIAVAYS